MFFTKKCYYFPRGTRWNHPFLPFGNLGRVYSGDHPPIPQTQLFKCTLCDFGFDSERDLNIHITSKHIKIDQIDGNISLLEYNENNLSLLNPTEDL